MAVGIDPGSTEQSDTDGEPLVALPVRRVDDDRWQASWDRFQAAHDDADAFTGSADEQVAVPSVDLDRTTRGAVLGTAARSVPREPEPAPTAAPPTAPRAADPPPVAAAAEPPPLRSADPVPAPAPPTAPAAASAAELTSLTLLRPSKPASATRWRRAVRSVSGGSIQPGPSKAERSRRERADRITAPLHGCHRIAVVSLKGGVGKTTVTACLGLTLAHHRGDRVVALDANPDSGTLGERLVGTGAPSVAGLLANADRLRSFADVSAYTALVERLQVVGSELDPMSSQAFDEVAFRATDEILSRFFTVVLVDSGSGLLHPAMTATLASADSLVVVAGPTVDAAGQAAKTLDWLVAHGHGELVARAVAVISAQRADAGDVDTAVLVNHFASRCRRVVQVPFDPHLATGGRIERERWQLRTTDAFADVAAAVAEAFTAVPR